MDSQTLGFRLSLGFEGKVEKKKEELEESFNLCF